MSMNRRKFIFDSVKSILVIGLGNTLQSFSSSGFVLPPLQDVRLRFAMASDGHYGQEGTYFDQFHDEMMNWLNREHQQRKLAFTMINGDLVHNDNTLFSTVKKKYDKLKMPYYVSHGNHDHCDEKTWQAAWKTPRNFSFQKNDVGFVVLDTADDTGNYICPNVEWTKKELAKYKSKKEVFVFMHITPFKWTENGIDCADLVAAFNDQPNLKAIFHGHDHDQDNVKTSNGKPYFFDSHIGGNWGTSYRGYRVVEVLKNGSILTYQVNPTTQEHVNSMNL